jgi:RHS repeat-associated protein
MIGTLTRDMSTSLVAVGENVQSSEYVYDHMGRLMTGSIEFVGKVGNKYAVSTSYNKAGGLLSKVSSPDASAQVFAATSQEMTYDLTYQYSGTKPHQLSQVISSQGVPYAMSFSYNASGSISEITDLMGVDHSSYYWGQEQWLCGVENAQGIHHYVYDHAGERIMKSSITQTTVQLNDETINTVTTLEPYTLYVNPYYVVTSFSNADQRSKHYYMGTQRVATDIGVDYGVSPSPEQLSGARGGDDAATAGETPQGLETDQTPFQSLGYKQDLERVLLGLSGEIGVEDLSEALAPIESFYPDLSAGVNSGEGIESELPLYLGTRIMYWYHPDYVSNVDMVTDRSGEAYELFLYNAWGESLHHWTSSSTNSWSSPYRLNSKELDSETGMHYYGARYHHPKLNVWMSVDPLAHQTLEAYQFTGNNPIALIDPDGSQSQPSVKSYYMNSKGYYMEGNSSFGEYVGNSLPGYRYYELVEIQGKYYHKNASDPFKRMYNWITNSSVVENKDYDPAGDELMNEALFMGIGLGALKAGSLAFNALKGAGGSLWNLPSKGGTATRGFVWEKILAKPGAMKSHNFPVIDFFYKGVATSAKTLDIHAASYSAGNRILGQLMKYVDELASFEGASWGGDQVWSNQINRRVLDVAIPRGATPAQVQQLEKAIELAKNKNVEILIHVVQ